MNSLESAQNQYYHHRWRMENDRFHPPNPERIQRVVDQVAHHVTSPNASILDVGCGNGWVLQGLDAQLSGELSLYGIEPTEEGCHNSRKRVPRAEVYSGLLKPGIFPNQFDIIVCSEVIEHVAAQDEFIDLLVSCLADNGTLILTTPNHRYRQTYFADSGAQPQPVEEWIDESWLVSRLRRSFAHVSVTFFDLGYYLDRHPIIAAIRRGICRLPVLWRLKAAIDRSLTRRRGLYMLAVARARNSSDISA